MGELIRVTQLPVIEEGQRRGGGCQRKSPGLYTGDDTNLKGGPDGTAETI